MDWGAEWDAGWRGDSSWQEDAGWRGDSSWQEWRGGWWYRDASGDWVEWQNPWRVQAHMPAYASTFVELRSWAVGIDHGRAIIRLTLVELGRRWARGQ